MKRIIEFTFFIFIFSMLFPVNIIARKRAEKLNDFFLALALIRKTKAEKRLCKNFWKAKINNFEKPAT